MDLFPYIYGNNRLSLCRNSRGILQILCKSVGSACDAGVWVQGVACLTLGGRAGLWDHEGASADLAVSLPPSLAFHGCAGAEWVELFFPGGKPGCSSHTCCLKILLNCWHRLADIPLFSDNSDSELNWLQGASAALYSNKDLMPANGWACLPHIGPPHNDMKLTFNYLAWDQKLGMLLLSFPQHILFYLQWFSFCPFDLLWGWDWAQVSCIFGVSPVFSLVFMLSFLFFVSLLADILAQLSIMPLVHIYLSRR